MKEDKWLEFIELKANSKTKVYTVLSKYSDDELGHVKWYAQWKHYCFFPTMEFQTVYSDRCLMSILDFVSNLNIEHKIKQDKKNKW